MRIYLAGIVLLGMLSAGCTSDWDPARAARTAETKDEGAPKQDYPSATMSSRPASTHFASLPDRGELLRYSPDRQVQRSGAYTLHPVEFSEDHALNAIASGELKVKTPDGKSVDIKYDRIEEHPDGNWSWVGQNASGEHAVLTFGERAVFGEVFAGGRTFRVTMRNGSSWLVETNPSMLAGSNHGQRDDGPDFLIPPETVASAAATVMAGAKASGVPTKAVAVVDLAVGYTNGLVTTYGSQAAAITRVTSLVMLANAAYQRSGVNMRVRLVNATQVNFADNTDNSDALQKLTGYNQSTQQFVTPDAAFNALRAAREEFGADLVALVRPHRSPEQNGCGIAWLLGANNTNIVPASDERFGYSVVSDGGDINEGDGHDYFCSDYSLAHELGHNMGQVHNQGDAPVSGRHPYSYGFREASTTGFYTLMAYPIANSSQEEIAYFATPLINYAAGRPVGNAANADNVRSLNETMPIVAQFRETKVPVGGAESDFNGDGLSDILWRNATNGQNGIWRSGTTQIAMPTIADTNWRVVGVGDFNGDGTSDILWRHSVTGQNGIWRSGDFSNQMVVGTVSDANWRVVGVGDFNGDGMSDILWRHAVTGQNGIWRSGTTQVAIPTIADTNWQVVGVGDFNGDGTSDILWRHAVTGQNGIWRSGDFSNQMVVGTVSDANWRVVGVGDFNGDGMSDILWRHAVTGQNGIWRSGTTQVAIPTIADTNWQVVGVGDFNGDGTSDILWRHAVTGQNGIWRSGDFSNQMVVGTVSDPAWQVVPRR